MIAPCGNTLTATSSPATLTNLVNSVAGDLVTRITADAAEVEPGQP